MVIWLLMSVLLWASTALAQTQCAALRAIDHAAQPAYLVECTGGEVAITVSAFNANKGKNSNFGQFCPNGPANPAAREEGRWQTASGFPEICDVFTTNPREAVRQAGIVYFVHSDMAEQEIDTTVHQLVYAGNDLVNFHPPVPGIIVGP